MNARAAAWIVALAAMGSCAPAGPPAIAVGRPCAGCGMEIRDLRFACERSSNRGWRMYDSIECLLRDPPRTPGSKAVLADYDRSTLAPAESLWVVRGEFPSPMGGGLAAFRDRAAAEQVARETRGRTGRLGTFAGELR